MAKEKGDFHGWTVNEEPNRIGVRIDASEMSVPVQTHLEESDNLDSVKVDSSRRKCSFRHFVEESTLRNIALDELEELSDAGGIAGVDGDIVRTSSSISSEQVPIKFAVILQWDTSYFNKPQGLLRLALLACSTISLACITSAGTNDIDVLQLPLSSYIRVHILISILSILVTFAFLFVDVTSLVQSFPVQWNTIDALLSGFLSVLFIISSSILLHAEHVYQRYDPPISDWTRVQVSLAAVFGFLGTLVCVFLTVVRWCGQATSHTSEDIMLSSMRAS